jgi:predicted extracellular nuclease
MSSLPIQPAMSSAFASTVSRPRPEPTPAPGPATNTTIGEVQGTGLRSPFEGKNVRVKGVVTAVHQSGFYIQAVKGEAAPASRGLLVYSKSPTVKPGDEVTITGTIQEYRYEKAVNDLTVTELVASDIKVGKKGLDLDTVLGPPRRIGKGGLMPPTSSGPEGIKFWEGIEGERVELNDLLVVGATDRGTFYAVPDGGQWATTITNRGTLIQGDAKDVQPEVIAIRHEASNGLATPQLKVGDRLPGKLTGEVSYNFGRYQLNVDTFPEVKEAPKPEFKASLKGSATEMLVLSFNAENLDMGDGQARFDEAADKIADAYNAPDAVCFQEIQDDSGPKDDGTVTAEKTLKLLCDTIKKKSGIEYIAVEIAPKDHQDGGEPGGNIRCAMLLRKDRVELVKGSVQRIGEGDPNFESTRKALEVSLKFKPTGELLSLIDVHNSAKLGAASPFGEQQPPPPDPSQTRRIGQLNAEQKRMVELGKEGKRVLLVGDHNETPEETVKHTEASLRSKIENLSIKLPADAARSYIFSGSAQTIDQAQVTVGTKAQLEIDDTNCRLPDKSPDRDSDHGHFLVLVDMRPRDKKAVRHAA